MAHPGFPEFVGRLVEAMGQSVAAVRPREELILLRTPDGFLYAFVDDTTLLSLEHLRRLFGEVPDTPSKVVVLTPDRIPLALGTEIVRLGGTLIEGSRFTELAKTLGLGEELGEPPRANVEPRRARLLPSARQLDEVMARAETWQAWGVPALALRFYHQAAELKPEFAPAKIGVGQSLLTLGLPMEAERVYEQVLRANPGNVDAQIGKAAVLGATGKPDKEIAAYRALLAENTRRPDVRAHLLAALLDARAWSDARKEVEAMLEGMPDDPRLRFLHSVTLERTATAAEAHRERERARALGLPYESERVLCEHLGLPVPPPPEVPPPTGSAPTSERASSGTLPKRPPRAPKPRATRPAPHRAPSRRTPAKKRPRG
jgi:tetratricopeptide (TPR) repeat protein